MSHMPRARQQVMTCPVTHGTKALADQAREWRLEDRVPLAGLPSATSVVASPATPRIGPEDQIAGLPEHERGSGADTRI